jgi:L-ribulose-5-phosphate 3-epimerase
MTRRQILALGAAAVPSTVSSMAAAPRLIKGVTSSVFPAGMPYTECMQRAADAGFEAIEIRLHENEFLPPTATREDAARIADVAAAKRIQIASLWILTPSSPSLTSSNADERADAMARVQAGIRLAPALRCAAMLVTPAVLGRGAKMECTHDQAWEIATKAFRAVIPDAERAGILITPENVWNRFLVSPRDMRAFVDQFQSKAIAVHFDTGNCLQFGYPEDWILTLGPRIRRVHFKDFKLAGGGRQGQFVPLLDGDVNWRGVMSCLSRVGYQGFVSVEAGPDPKDTEYLLKLSRAMDRILAMG